MTDSRPDMLETPVLIAGGGPVGMTLACDLAGRGIRCILVERNEATTRHPKMDITNARSMELFRRLGLVPAMRAAGVPEDHCFDVSWVTTMAGRELHRFSHLSVIDARASIKRRNDGSQPVEPPMRISQVELEPVLKNAIDNAPNVDVRFATAVEELSKDDDGVTVTLRRAADGSTQTVRCRYLVGCDGGGSVVRERLGIGLGGQARIMPRFMTHFRSSARQWLQRWGIAWHYQSPLGTLIAQNDHDLWTLHSRDPDDSPFSVVDPSLLLRAFLGTDVEHQVLVANRWSPHLLVADRYGAGRVLIAGDAAHQYIPTGGYGMNTGIGDACDVAWKLAAVLHGFAAPGLLESYEAERRPVGLRNCAGSGMHNDTRRHIASLYREAGVYGAQPPTQDVLDRLGAEIGRIGNAENESFGLELGYAYRASPVICADDSKAAPDDTRTYQPSTVPGVRLPNVMLEDGLPLHDLLGPWFTLLSFNGGHSQPFAAAALARSVPLKVVTLSAEWLADIYGREPLLIRPDQHIAWRGAARQQTLDQSAAGDILRRALGDSVVNHAVRAA